MKGDLLGWAKSSATAWSINGVVCPVHSELPCWGREHSVWGRKWGTRLQWWGGAGSKRALNSGYRFDSGTHSVCLDFNSSDRYWFLFLFLIIIYFLFYFTMLHWFCHTLTWICHRCTWVPNPEPPSHLSPHIISLGHPSAPAPSILYPVSNLDWRFVSYRYWFYIILSSIVTESDLAACHSEINTQERQMLVESKAGFNQNAGSLGEMVNSVSCTTTSQDSAWPWKVLRRKGDGISVHHWDGGQCCCSPPVCGLVLQPCSCCLVPTACSHSLFGRLLEGKLGKRSGRLLLILHFYFFDPWKEPTG